jgi:hypothetical protein
MVILASSGTIPIFGYLSPKKNPEVDVGFSLGISGAWFGFPQFHQPYDDDEYLYITFLF